LPGKSKIHPELFDLSLELVNRALQVRNHRSLHLGWDKGIEG